MSCLLNNKFKILFFVLSLFLSTKLAGNSVQNENIFEKHLYPKKITIIGTGYVGLVMGTGLAELGNEVTCVDIIKEKIEKLQNGEITIYEVGLEDLIQKNMQKQKLFFSSDIESSIRNCEVIFIAVGTPQGQNGDADLSAIESVAEMIGKNLNTYKVICLKSTVPIGTAKKLSKIIKKYAEQDSKFDVVSNPEFLREGSAVYDFFYPDRIVIGFESDHALKIIEEAYWPLLNRNISLLKTDFSTAEAIKYASNAFLAVKISFINEFSALCEKMDANIIDVAKGMGLDKRIGADFLKPGPGYGGSCFPKDTLALLNIAHQAGIELKITKAAVEANEIQKKRMVQKLLNFFDGNIENKTIAILGLAFKANTDDVRCSPAIDIIQEIKQSGGCVKAYDPIANDSMKKIIPEIEYCDTLYKAVENADAVMLLTDWEEFRKMDLTLVYSLMKTPILIDTRNLFNPNDLRCIGYKFANVGRVN